jgi:hypothetical protein
MVSQQPAQVVVSGINPVNTSKEDLVNSGAWGSTMIKTIQNPLLIKSKT